MSHIARRFPAWMLLAAVAWLLLSIGWSYFLAASAAAEAGRSRLLEQATRIAWILSQRIISSPENSSETNTAHPMALGDMEDHQGFQDDLDAAVRPDADVAYAMLWSDDGQVVAHTDQTALGRFLDANKWPALDPGQRFRIVHFDRPPEQWASLQPKATPITEITVPVKVGQKTFGFLTLAEAAPNPVLLMPLGLHIAILSCSVLGLVVVLSAIGAARHRFDKSRREILQTSRARTSLLTERGMLASVLAHEVRSPLTALRFNLHALRQFVAQGGGDDKQAELADRCEREIRRLDSMLTDFLQHTQVLTQPEPTAVNAVIHEAVEFLRPALDRHNIRVSLHLDPGEPRINVHPDELRQVILNLAANSQEAMERGGKGGTLAFSTLAEAVAEGAGGGAGMVTLLIRDSGVGISAEFMDRIFEPFFSTKPNGSGLGLTLVRRVISGAGGTVSCESNDEGTAKGTTFRIMVPRAGE